MFCMETGGGYSTLQKLCSVFGIPNMTEGTFQRLQKHVSAAQVQSNDIMLRPKGLEILRNRYTEQFPFTARSDDEIPEYDWDVDDGIPWIDVSFDGTWQRCGHVSHYDVGVVVDALKGYVIDFHVMSTYCHTCKLQDVSQFTRPWKRIQLSFCGETRWQEQDFVTGKSKS